RSKEAAYQGRQLLQTVQASHDLECQVGFVGDGLPTNLLTLDVLPHELVRVQLGRIPGQEKQPPSVDSTKRLTILARWEVWPSTTKKMGVRHCGSAASGTR